MFEWLGRWLLAGVGGGAAGIAVWRTWDMVWSRSAHTKLQEQLRRILGGGDAATRGLTLRQNPYSELQLLRRAIAQFSVMSHLATFLEQAGSRMNVSSYLLAHGCSALAGLIVSLLIGWPVLICFGVMIATGCLPWLMMQAKRARRFRNITEQLPDAVRLMASALRAGLGLDAGLNIVASELPDPIRTEFTRLMNESRLYADMREALRRLAERLPIPDIQLFAASAALHREVGGNFASMLDQLERTIRDRFQLYRELKALTAESRLSGWVLGALPLVVGVALFLLNRTYYHVLFTDPTGTRLLWAAVALQVVGFGVIYRMTNPRFR